MQRPTVLLALLALLSMPACRSRPTPAPAAPPPGPSTAPAPSAPSPSAVPSTPAGAPAPSAVRDASLLWENDRAALANDYECALKEVVTSPDERDPRVAIWRAYDAARRAVVEGTDAPYAELFADQFTRSQSRPWILEQFWPRAKTHVAKYTASSKDTTFVLCRIDESDGRWKAFVKSFSRDKSNPPITVEIEDGTPRISFFTY